MNYQETITAIVTPTGIGGVGIIRVSGPKSRSIAHKIFSSNSEKFSDFIPHRLHHGKFLSQDGFFLDEGLAVLMPSPNSYTGEDTLELNCHGGPAVLAAVLEAVIRAGARPAVRGEFTKRAFLNGKMDLTAAEAVAELIASPGRAAIALAGNRLSGLMQKKLDNLRKRLQKIRTDICLAVDFPEEDFECLPRQELLQSLHLIQKNITELCKAHDRFAVWQNGARVVLAGKVNAGKSSLMNALIGRNRAIVTSIPGTTRDYLEEPLLLDGLAVRLFDTAGMRISTNPVESKGIEQSRLLLKDADLVLWVADLKEDIHISEISNELEKSGSASKTLLVLNKADLPDLGASPAQIDIPHIRISALTGQGLDTLCDLIKKMCTNSEPEPDEEALIPNLRQKKGLEMAKQELEAMQEDIQQEIPFDLLGVRLEMACTYLDELTGKIHSSQILDDIFSNFCIGK